MHQRKPVVGLSFKLYQNKAVEAEKYAETIHHLVGNESDIEQFFCPAMGVLSPVSHRLKDSLIGLGSQNIAPVANGAYTGEFSIESLIEMGGKYVELGHCERREYFHETDELINRKLLLTLANNLTPVLCIGEKEKVSKEELIPILSRQLYSTLSFIPADSLKKVIIAYEPIWAVGKALAASAPYIHQSHHLIRQALKKLFSSEIAESIRIIYGGSVSQENVATIVGNEDVDGVFIGRFGHDPMRYASIVKQVKNIKREGR